MNNKEMRDSKRKAKGLFVGLCTKDTIFYADSLPLHNHKVKTTEFATYIGGPAANAAITYAALGGDATLATCLGNSMESHMLIEQLESYGVSVLNYSNYDTVPNVASIVVTGDGKRTIVSGQQPFCVNKEYDLQCYDFVLFDCNQQEISLDILKQSDDKVIVLDAGSYKPNMHMFLDKADIIIASEDFKDENWNSDFSLTSKAKHRAITRGDAPILYNGKELPVCKVNAVDTLGAGDIFHGAFCYAYFEDGTTCEDALLFAAKVAGESVKYQGPREWIKYWR